MSGRWTLWTRLSYGYALLVIASLGYFLLRIPIQVSDSFTNLLALDRPFGVLMRETMAQPGYMRPGLWAGLKVVYDLSGGDYYHWYRWTQVLQVAAAVLLFVHLVRPRTQAAALALPLAIAVLVGSHTFAWTVREAFPINTFLTIVVCALAAANLALAESPRWWRDAAAVVLFAASALTVESGLLIGGIFIAAYLVGARGVSGRGVLAVVVLIAGYFVVRFGVLSVGMPSLAARDAGFGFGRRTAVELASTFAASRPAFYAYNVVSSIAGVLFAEPRDGVWQLTRSIVLGRPDRVLIIGAVSSTLATLLVVRHAWRRRRQWRSRQFEYDDRVVLLFAAVLVGNAVISYAYTKDVIMSPAGVFFAGAVFIAVRDLLDSLRGARALATLAGVLLLATLSVTWGIRQVGLHAGLARTAVQVREHWAYIDDWLFTWHYDELSPHVAAMRRQLQDDAVVRHPAPMPLRERWTGIFEVE